MIFFLPYVGLLPMMVLVAVMYMTTFFLSHYLNRITPSGERATVLSFKGLSFNLAYGLAGWFYALLLAHLRPGIAAAHPELTHQGLENAVFVSSISWFPWYFIVILAILIIFSIWRLKGTAEYRLV